ncbi:MAG TPA: MFS transporter [Burkholderiaceae bacterium]
MNRYSPKLTLMQIINMNIGFFGIQFSFGLQQSNMSPIYKFLGADEATLPLLWLAGPVTGLIVQPIIGSMSDRTVTRLGRRTPYFLVGAILCSLGLLAMPFSSSLWMAAGILWILDAANNVTMEPYRAFVGDKLDSSQHSTGFLIQSAFTGFGQALAYLTPSILVAAGMDSGAVTASNIPHITVATFLIGAVFSTATILWTVKTTPEAAGAEPGQRTGRATLLDFRATAGEILAAFKEMPLTMRQLALVKLFQWYAMFCYWQYIVLSLSTTLFGTTDEHSAAFRAAGLLNGKIGAFYNFVAFLAALAMLPLAKRYGAKLLHCASLFMAGCAMFAIPMIHSPALLLLPMVAIGIAWASMMGNPYVLLAGCIPAERVGVYMGIFNMFIVIPMMIEIFTLPLIYRSWLAGNPENVIRLAGALLICGAAAVLLVRTAKANTAAVDAGYELP